MFFLVTRPVLSFVTHLVEADSKDKALIKIEEGGGLLFHMEEERPTKDKSKMQIRECPGLDKVEDGRFHIVDRKEIHTQQVLIRAENEDAAIQRVNEGEGDELHGTEYVDTMDCESWSAEQVDGPLGGR